jgi:hypothetical protein
MEEKEDSWEKQVLGGHLPCANGGEPITPQGKLFIEVSAQILSALIISESAEVCTDRERKRAIEIASRTASELFDAANWL